ncbi:MAG: hypothetical protein AB2810_21125 [Candidatus Thiodiazotropha endolucinida]
MSKHKSELQGKLSAFLKHCQREVFPAPDPNNRPYSRDIEREIKTMDPEELDEIMSGEDKEVPQNAISKPGK